MRCTTERRAAPPSMPLPAAAAAAQPVAHRSRLHFRCCLPNPQDFTTRMYRIRRTCLEMLADRGYLITEVGARRPLWRWEPAAAAACPSVCKAACDGTLRGGHHSLAYAFNRRTTCHTACPAPARHAGTQTVPNQVHSPTLSGCCRRSATPAWMRSRRSLDQRGMCGATTSQSWPPKWWVLGC